MIIRKLDRREHGKTRSLYETVFTEDSRKFVDYYYTWKTRDNTIYVAEDEEGIHSMVHLNPFWVSVNGRRQMVHYIVAVATEEKYRHCGLMRSLLNLAMDEMAENGEPFTFLLPASEAIYLPFGFQFVSRQRQGILLARQISEHSGGFCPEQNDLKSDAAETAVNWGNQSCGIVREMPEYHPVCAEEYQILADFVNKTLAKQTNIFVLRDAAYYERLIREQRSQNGDVMVIFSGKEIIGTFCTTQEEDIDIQADSSEDLPLSQITCSCDIREVIVKKGYHDEVFHVLQEFADQNGNCKVSGYLEDFKFFGEKSMPLMMARELAAEPGGDKVDERTVRAASLPVIFINETV